MFARPLAAASFVAALAASASCAEPPARARLVMRHDGAASVAARLTGAKALAIEPAAPRRFAMRLEHVYLVEDVDPATQGNVGLLSSIWKNEACPGPGRCAYFDFAGGTASVNAALNAQDFAVEPGTYRYVRLEFCQGGPPAGAPNVEWQGGGMPSPRSLSLGVCGITSARFEPPVVIAAGEGVAVTLAYDLEEAMARGAVVPEWPAESHALRGDDGAVVPFLDCATEGQTKTCVALPAFAPSAAKL